MQPGWRSRDLIPDSAFGRNHSRNHGELSKEGGVNMQAAGLAGCRHSFLHRLVRQREASVGAGGQEKRKQARDKDCR